MPIDSGGSEQAARAGDVRALLATGEYEGRTRSLADIDRRLRVVDTPLARAIEEQLARRRPVAVLEIGFGWARALLELAWRFRAEPVTFAGINLKAKPPVERAEDLPAVAEALGIVPPGATDALRPPDVHFYDATNLHFADESLDFVYSAATIRFVADKARLVEEVARVLRPEGRAILEIGERGWEYPAGPATDPVLLTPHPCRFVVHRDLQLVPLADHLAAAAGARFTIRVPPGRRCVIDMSRHALGPLDLGLVLDEERTIPMRRFPHPRPKGAGGIRSAYRVVDG